MINLANLEYPRHLHKRDGAFLVCRSAEDAAAALKDGWSLMPVLDIYDPPPIASLAPPSASAPEPPKAKKRR